MAESTMFMQLEKIPELERELRASNQKIAALEQKLAERDGSPRASSQQLVEKVALMEKRLKEAGLSTEQSGQHELVRETQRLQLWIQSLNGGWSSNITPGTWTNPIPALEKRCTQLQAQYERVQADIQRVQSTHTQIDPVQSTRTQFDQVQSNRTQFDQVQSDRSQLQSNPRGSNLFGSNSTNSNPMGSDQISFNRDGFNSMPSNQMQSNTTDSSQMPSSGLSAARLNPDPASTSPFDQLDPLRTQSNSGLSPRDPSNLVQGHKIRRT